MVGMATLVAAVLLLLGGGAWWLHRRRQQRIQTSNEEALRLKAEAKRRLKLEELFARAVTGDEGALNALQPYRHYEHAGEWWHFIQEDERLRERFDEVVAAGKAERHYLNNIDRMVGRRTAVSAAETTADLVDAMLALVKGLASCYTSDIPDSLSRIEAEIGITHDQAMWALNELLIMQLTELLAQAEAGDMTAFVKAEELVISTKRWEGPDAHEWEGKFRGVKVNPLIKLPGWNELVVRYYPRPRYSQFATDGLERRELAYIAAEAYRNRNLMQAQLVLAACGADDWVRTLIGDVRHAQLADLVIDLQMVATPVTHM